MARSRVNPEAAKPALDEAPAAAPEEQAPEAPAAEPAMGDTFRALAVCFTSQGRKEPGDEFGFADSAERDHFLKQGAIEEVKK